MPLIVLSVFCNSTGPTWVYLVFKDSQGEKCGFHSASAKCIFSLINPQTGSSRMYRQGIKGMDTWFISSRDSRGLLHSVCAANLPKYCFNRRHEESPLSQCTDEFTLILSEAGNVSINRRNIALASRNSNASIRAGAVNLLDSSNRDPSDSFDVRKALTAFEVDFEEFVKYTNKYFVTIIRNGSSPIVLERTVKEVFGVEREKCWTDYTHYISRSQSQTEDAYTHLRARWSDQHSPKPKEVNLMKKYLEHPSKNVLDTTRWEPFRLGEQDNPVDPARHFNTWDHSVVSKEELEPFRNRVHDFIDRHLLDLCGGPGNENLHFYVKCWLACQFVFPGLKLRSTLTVIGREGAGKSSYFTPILRYLGSGFKITNNFDDVVGAWNSMMEGAVLIMLEDAIFAGDKSQQDKYKSVVSENTQLIRKKYAEPRPQTNHANIINLSNRDFGAVSVSGDGRRNVVITAAEKNNNEVIALCNRMREDDYAAVKGWIYSLFQMEGLSEFARLTGSRDSLVVSSSLEANALACSDNHVRWWYDVLKSGEILDLLYSADHGYLIYKHLRLPHETNWASFVSPSILWKSFSCSSYGKGKFTHFTQLAQIFHTVAMVICKPQIRLPKSVTAPSTSSRSTTSIISPDFYHHFSYLSHDCVDDALCAGEYFVMDIDDSPHSLLTKKLGKDNSWAQVEIAARTFRSFPYNYYDKGASFSDSSNSGFFLNDTMSTFSEETKSMYTTGLGASTQSIYYQLGSLLECRKYFTKRNPNIRFDNEDLSLAERQVYDKLVLPDDVKSLEASHKASSPQRVSLFEEHPRFGEYFYLNNRSKLLPPQNTHTFSRSPPSGEVGIQYYAVLEGQGVDDYREARSSVGLRVITIDKALAVARATALPEGAHGDALLAHVSASSPFHASDTDESSDDEDDLYSTPPPNPAPTAASSSSSSSSSSAKSHNTRPPTGISNPNRPLTIREDNNNAPPLVTNPPSRPLLYTYFRERALADVASLPEFRDDIVWHHGDPPPCYSDDSYIWVAGNPIDDIDRPILGGVGDPGGEEGWTSREVYQFVPDKGHWLSGIAHGFANPFWLKSVKDIPSPPGRLRPPFPLNLYRRHTLFYWRTLAEGEHCFFYISPDGYAQRVDRNFVLNQVCEFADKIQDFVSPGLWYWIRGCFTSLGTNSTTNDWSNRVSIRTVSEFGDESDDDDDNIIAGRAKRVRRN